jgi:hypothetical protein
LYSFQVVFAQSNQIQYSNHKTPPIESIAFARYAFNLLKTGSPNACGGFLIIHSTIPQLEFHSFFKLTTYSSIFFAASKFAALKGFFSITSKFGLSILYGQICLVYQKNSVQNFSFKNCFAIAPAITLDRVSLQLLLHPHL